MEFKAYRHRAPTRARKLTEADYISRQGIIETLEGPQPFSPGDYLARNAKGEWPIKHETLAKNYIQVTPEDEEGFAGYRRLGFRLAAQMPEAFTIDGMRGEAGDYLVVNEGAGWPVNREIFEQRYV
jgi:hypothetical protein